LYLLHSPLRVRYTDLTVGANTGSRVANTVIRSGAALFIDALVPATDTRVKLRRAISRNAPYGMVLVVCSATAYNRLSPA
jgi:hypothetical protein